VQVVSAFAVAKALFRPPRNRPQESPDRFWPQTRNFHVFKEPTAARPSCGQGKEAMTKRVLFPVLILAMALAGVTAPAGADTTDAASKESARGISNQKVSTMKIRINIDGKAITATLVDNATSRDFVSLLPLTLTLKDYAATEKVSDLPRRLSTEGAPPGSDPSIGDVTYYAPWGNLTIFYKDFGYSSGLIKLGRIDAGIDALNVSGPVKATIEPVEQ
jgi:hypothetical protein